jgi:TfoX/Sxy family transcriptional regulator of competence genes
MRFPSRAFILAKGDVPMPYNLALAERVWSLLADVPGVTEQRMFGGVGYLVNGNMLGGVLKDDLIVRVGAPEYAAMLALPHTSIFEGHGRPMSGWITVQPAGWASDEDLRAWVERGVEFALTLPVKGGS